MTPKQAEHWLIDHDFNYFKSDEGFAYWAHKSTRPQVIDSMVQEHPKDAIRFVASEMGVDL